MISAREAQRRHWALQLALPWRTFDLESLDPRPAYRCRCTRPWNRQQPKCPHPQGQHALAVLAGEEATAPDIAATMFHHTRASRWLHPWTEKSIARTWLSRGRWGRWAFSGQAWMSPLSWPEALRPLWGLVAPSPWEMANCYTILHKKAPYLIAWCSGLTWDTLIAIGGSASKVVVKMREEIATLMTQPKFLIWLYRPQLTLLPDSLWTRRTLRWKALRSSDWWRMLQIGAFPQTNRVRPLHWRLVRNGWWLGLT